MGNNHNGIKQEFKKILIVKYLFSNSRVQGLFCDSMAFKTSLFCLACWWSCLKSLALYMVLQALPGMMHETKPKEALITAGYSLRQNKTDKKMNQKA